MSELGGVGEILDFAIESERAAARFYRSLARRVDRPWISEIFEGFAREEDGHEARLLQIRDGKALLGSATKIADLKIGDYLVPVEAADPATLDYQSALVIAMKREKAAFRLYSDLAARTDDAALRDVLLGLAQEEAKHKLRFEVEYDEVVLREN